MNSTRNIWVALIAVAILALGAYAFPKATQQVVEHVAGGITTGTNFKFGISVGNTTTLGVVPTNIAKVLASTCSLIAPSFTVAASTTVAMDCAVTGAVSGDKVIAQFASSTATFGGWQITGASASTTSGFITLNVYNAIGVSSLIPASLASSTTYWLWGTQ